MEDQTDFTTKTNPRKDESTLFGASGRFWIAMVFSMGFVALIIISVLTQKVPDATLAASFGTTCGLVVGNYMGQHSKPKNQQ